MATYVLVHGGGHGGWCYQPVRQLLRAAGHDVYTPTLTGLGERSHLMRPGIDLDTHITDVVNVLQYHDLRDDRSLFNRLGLERLCNDAEVERAVTEPPTTTRAYFRGKCLQRWPNDIVAANWDSMVFDIGGATLQRVPMMEPTRGTKAQVGPLLDAADSAADLLERLGA